MKSESFIITGLQPWDIPFGSNAIDIAKEISLNNKVLYVNSPLDQMTLLRKQNTPEFQYRLGVLKGKNKPLRKISDSLWVLDFPFSVWSVNAFPDGPIFDFFNRLNNRKTFRYIQTTAAELGFKNFFHFIDNDIYRSFFSRDFFPSRLSVYYRRDNLQPFDYWKKHVRRLEPLLIEKSHLVLCNSPQLAEFALRFNPKSYNIGQGVDLSAYRTDTEYPKIPIIEAIPTPRIGYIGDITSVRLNADLIYDLAKSKPEYSFVIIGREDKVFAAHALHSLKNVYFTGSIPKADVPMYMSALQVCLNPQLLNEVTIGNYPRKVDEYLALGKPVVATKTATMEIFREHSYLCSNLEEYQHAVDAALRENSPEKEKARIQFARSHSWENNVNQIYTHIQQALTKKA
jgi:teichuronic acid biosynthesis glycosyltransferase TuaH